MRSLSIVFDVMAFPIFLAHGMFIPARGALAAHDLLEDAVPAISVLVFRAVVLWLESKVF